MVRPTRYLLYEVSGRGKARRRGRGREGERARPRPGSSLHDEVAVGKHVVAHEDAGHVAQDLEDQAARHGDEEAPGLVADPQKNLRQQAEAEERGEEGVARQRREVGHVAQEVAVQHERAGACRAQHWVHEQRLVECFDRDIAPVRHSRGARHGGCVVSACRTRVVSGLVSGVLIGSILVINTELGRHLIIGMSSWLGCRGCRACVNKRDRLKNKVN